MDDGAMDEPELLSGGNASGAVVRIGTTVRKPWSPTTPRVQDFVAALRERGIDLPRPLGRDEQGRAVSEYVPGVLAMDMGELDAELLRRVGSLVRSIHEASRGLAVPQDWPVLLPAPDAADLLCHNDLAPWNLVIDGERLVFIDADGAGPSTRLWDLAYAAVAFCRVFAGEDPEGVASRLGAFLDGYGREDAELMAALPDALGERCAAMHRMLVQARAEGTQPWASMHDDGHGAHWEGAAAFARRHRAVWQRVCARSGVRRSPEIICICGSTRFLADMRTASRDLALAGVIVLAPAELDASPTREQKAVLDELHLRKIDMADRVLVVNPGGYIGESTRREIQYAEQSGTPVSFTDPR